MTVMAAVDPMHSHNKPESLDNRVIDAASIAASQLVAELHVVHAYAETARPFAVAGTIKSEHSKAFDALLKDYSIDKDCLLYTSPSPRDRTRYRMPSSA